MSRSSLVIPKKPDPARDSPMAIRHASPELKPVACPNCGGYLGACSSTKFYIGTLLFEQGIAPRCVGCGQKIHWVPLPKAQPA